ncbi:unnamed protein product [marine sediment metagenome]|uniref:Uncharacterized protein n=1 Tax=marine sediment metagenome TaxID=412755 RepID=X1AJK4_9ZZZZ
MSNWRVVITITRLYDDRTAALTGADSITSKVPNAWELREESVKRE